MVGYPFARNWFLIFGILQMKKLGMSFVHLTEFLWRVCACVVLGPGLCGQRRLLMGVTQGMHNEACQVVSVGR